MRDLIKGLFGTGTSLPDGVSKEWAGELKSMLAEAHGAPTANLSGRHLDAAVEFVLHGDGGTWVHPNPPKKPGGFVPPRPRPERPAFYAALSGIPADILLRWAQVLEAMAYVHRHSGFFIPFPGGVHWPEIVLRFGSGANPAVWPAPPLAQRIAYSTIERMLLAAGMEPHALLVGAFATSVDTGFAAGRTLSAVAYCPDFADALERHLEVVRPCILSGAAPQRVHVLTLLGRAAVSTLDRLAPELAELAVSSVKQVRIAADGLVYAAGAAIVPELQRLALDAKPEQRALALRCLYERGQRSNDQALCESSRAAARADKAPSVQALIGEWQSQKAAETTSESSYQFDAPSVDWGGAPDSGLSARLDKLWRDMNESIRAANQRARDQYERHTAQHGKPKWPLHQTKEVPADWLKELHALIASPTAPARDGSRPTERFGIVLPAIRALAAESVLRPTDLFKLLHHSNEIYAADGGLNPRVADYFNRLHASTGKPSLIELARMIEDAGHDPQRLFALYCLPYHGSIARSWPKQDVWPFMAQNVTLIERHLLGLERISNSYSFDRARIYDAIATLPVLPPRIVNALYTVALGQGKTERRQAQETLENLPDKEARIVSALADGKSEVRMVAAQWLGRLKFAPAVPALEKAVAAEKQENAKGTLLDALEVLGQPVDKYLKRDLLLPEARKSLAKGVPKDLAWFPWEAMPEVRWADSANAVPPEVLKWMIAQACRANSPEPNAVLRKYCATFEPRDRERFGQWILENWLSQDVLPISSDEAHKRARQEARNWFASMQSHPQFFQNSPLFGKSEEELFAFYLPGMLRMPAASAIGSKGVLAVAAACAGERAAAPAARYIKEWYGTRAAQGKALVAMLAWIEHPSATQVMLAIGNRFRTKGIQEEAMRQAEALAERKGWTLAELADRTIPTAGFDENGELELSYGLRTFIARLLADFKIELFNPDGKKIASLPEPRQEDDQNRAKDSKKSLSAARKEIKSVVDLQTDRLYEALCTGRDWSYSDWNDYLNRHPVVRHLAQRLIWLQQSEDGNGSAFRPLADGTLTDESDEAVVPRPGARIRLAHDTLLKPAEVKRWQQHLIDYEVKPLFQQLGKGTYQLPQAMESAKEIADFKGHLLEAFALRGRAGKLGYQRGPAEDGGWFHVYEKRFATLGILAVIEFTGSPLPEENRTVALLGLTFSPANTENRWERSALPLNKIPKVLLSECYNDFRLMAADGTGYDADWEKKSAY